MMGGQGINLRSSTTLAAFLAYFARRFAAATEGSNFLRGLPLPILILMLSEAEDVCVKIILGGCEPRNSE